MKYGIYFTMDPDLALLMFIIMKSHYKNCFMEFFTTGEIVVYGFEESKFGLIWDLTTYSALPDVW